MKSYYEFKVISLDDSGGLFNNNSDYSKRNAFSKNRKKLKSTLRAYFNFKFLMLEFIC